MDLLGDLGCIWTRITCEEAAAVARDVFGVCGEPTRFATEKDDTFRIACASGESWVLKIANPEESPEEIDFQIAVLDHLAEVDPQLPVPRVRRSRQGEGQVTLTMSDGVRRQARMLGFLPGTPLDSVPTTGPERYQVGEILARLRLALEGFAHPADSRILAWDVRHLLSLEALLPGVADPGRRAMIAHALDRFRQIEPEIGRTRFQVLHNDFSRSNIVVDKTAARFVKGVIDFGDTVRTSVAIDVSTALLNQLPREAGPDIFEDGRDLLRGYLSVAELTARELALVPHLVMARVVARALLTNWRARIMPDNATYILRNTQQGWNQLEWFLARPPAAVSAALLP
jgi:Ser/Thr protein kinase RdoA (MazF antagonist)